MAAFSVWRVLASMPRPDPGLRPEPQGVRTLAAGAAHQGLRAGARIRDASSKSVFDRHSTQSLIATRSGPNPRSIRALVVDGAVYAEIGAVYKLSAIDPQVPEYVPGEPYTARAAAEAHRA